MIKHSYLFFLDFNITMNSFAFATILALFVAYASATFDAATGVFSLGAVALNGGNSLALTLGSSTAFLTSAGIVAAGLALLGAGLIKAALLAGEEARGRSKRSSPVEQLAAIDNYFATIADMDVDDCGKLLVCQLESIPREVRLYLNINLETNKQTYFPTHFLTLALFELFQERTPEEGIIAGLFGESSTIDPASAKAEYDLAAYLGQATKSKVACARRYSRCPLDRKTISQALAKMARIPQQ